MTIRVLLVDGDPVGARLVLAALEREQLEGAWVRTGREALARLDEGWPALVVGALLEGPGAAELIETARRLGFAGAILALVAPSDAAAIRRLLRAGASDVLLRTSGSELVLGRLLLRALQEVWLRRRVERLQADVGGLARALARARPTDPLTGLATGWYFEARSRDERRRAARTGRPLTRVTVRLSPPTPPDANTLTRRLIRLADVLRTQGRSSDVVGRLAADTLAVLLPETGPEGGWTFVQRVAAALDAAGERDVGYQVESAAQGRTRTAA